MQFSCESARYADSHAMTYGVVNSACGRAGGRAGGDPRMHSSSKVYIGNRLLATPGQKVLLMPKGRGIDASTRMLASEQTLSLVENVGFHAGAK